MINGRIKSRQMFLAIGAEKTGSGGKRLLRRGMRGRGEASEKEAVTERKMPPEERQDLSSRFAWHSKSSIRREYKGEGRRRGVSTLPRARLVKSAETGHK